MAAGAVVAVELGIEVVGEAEAGMEMVMVMVKGGGARGGRCVP